MDSIENELKNNVAKKHDIVRLESKIEQQGVEIRVIRSVK